MSNVTCGNPYCDDFDPTFGTSLCKLCNKIAQLEHELPLSGDSYNYERNTRAAGRTL